jgi:hypothetical protein
VTSIEKGSAARSTDASTHSKHTHAHPTREGRGAIRSRAAFAGGERAFAESTSGRGRP